MIKETGKTHAQVTKLLRRRGIDPNGLKIATLPQSGPFHLVLIGEETIGEYNHLTKRLALYRDIEPDKNP